MSNEPMKPATAPATPATSGAQMAAPAAPTKMVAKVKIKATQPIDIGTAQAPRVLEPGDEAEVDDATAKEFCDRKFVGNYAFSGEQGGASAEQNRHIVTRAVRVA